MPHHTKLPRQKIFAKCLLFRLMKWTAPCKKLATFTALLVLWSMMQTKYHIRDFWPQNLNSLICWVLQNHCGIRQELQWAIGAKRAHFRMIWLSVNSLRQVSYLDSVQIDFNNSQEPATRRIKTKKFLKSCSVDNQAARIKVPTEASFTVTSSRNNEDSIRSQSKKVTNWA